MPKFNLWPGISVVAREANSRVLVKANPAYRPGIISELNQEGYPVCTLLLHQGWAGWHGHGEPGELVRFETDSTIYLEK